MAPNAALHTYHTEATAPQHAWQSMDTLTAGVPPDSTRRAAFDGAMVGAVPELGPGWVALRNCALGGGGPRVGLVLLHPSVGVALVDVVPKATDAAARLRRALDARRFPAIFGGYPPVARVVLPAERFPDLGRILDAEFEAQPPLALAGGDGWVRTARAALESELPVAAPERLRTKRPRRFRWRPVVLAGGASAAALVFGVGAALARPRRPGSLRDGGRRGAQRRFRPPAAGSRAGGPRFHRAGRGRGPDLGGACRRLHGGTPGRAAGRGGRRRKPTRTGAPRPGPRVGSPAPARPPSGGAPGGGRSGAAPARRRHWHHNRDRPAGIRRRSDGDGQRGAATGASGRRGADRPTRRRLRPLSPARAAAGRDVAGGDRGPAG
jgi:hypothetical protein